MYSLSGIINDLIILVLGGIMSFGMILSTKLWIKKYRKSKKSIISMFVGTLMLIGATFFSVEYIGALVNPDIRVFEGYYYRSYNKGRRYYFKNEDECEEFRIGSIPRRIICPEHFKIGVEYRIYYENNTDIIVRVEKLD